MGNFWIVPLLHTVSDMVQRLRKRRAIPPLPQLSSMAFFCLFQGKYYISSTWRRKYCNRWLNPCCQVLSKLSSSSSPPPSPPTHCLCRWQCIAYILQTSNMATSLQSPLPVAAASHILESKNWSFVCIKLHSSGSQKAHSGQHDRKRVVTRDRFGAAQRS